MTTPTLEALPSALSETRLTNTFLGNIIEICIVTADHQRTMEGLVRLGIGPWRVYTFNPENTVDMRYRGEPAEFVIKVCFARCGNVVWELMQPVSGPTIFQEFLDRHGEGVQHIAFDCGDMPLEERVAEFERRGFVPVQSGNWMGQNQFVFFGTQEAAGTVFEAIHFPLDFEYPEPERWYPAAPVELANIPQPSKKLPQEQVAGRWAANSPQRRSPLTGSAQMDSTKDTDAIAELIRSQFASLKWGEGSEADWPMFRSGFLGEALLFPAARPAQSQSVQEFIDRMRQLASDGTLGTFSERPLGLEVRVFGNVAVALAGCEMLENETKTTRDVSAFLLVKDNLRWQIAAQAWDFESDRVPISPSLSGSQSLGEL